MVAEALIEEDDKPVVMRSLLLRHRHVHDDRFRFSISGRKHSSYTSLQVSHTSHTRPPGAGPRRRLTLANDTMNLIGLKYLHEKYKYDNYN